MIPSFLVRLHFRSLSTNANHPKANKGTLTHRLFGVQPQELTNKISVCQDKICVLHLGLEEGSNIQPRLHVWKWQEGEKCFVRSFPSYFQFGRCSNLLGMQTLEYCQIQSFSFLSSNHLLFLIHPPVDVEQARDSEVDLRLVICDIEKTSQLDKDTGPNSYVATAEFYFPPFHDCASLGDVYIYSDPPPCSLSELDARTKDKNADSSVNDSVPFTIGALDRLFAIKIAIFIHGYRRITMAHLGIFVPLSTFIPYLLYPKLSAVIRGEVPSDEETRVLECARDEITIKWEDWIPSGTRILTLPNDNGGWVCDVYGMKFVHAEKTSHNPKRVIVLDFNSPDVLRNLLRGEGKGECGKEEVEDQTLYSEDVIETTTIDARGYIFAVNVTTGVPYRATCSKEKFSFERVMITEDNVVFVKVSGKL